MNNFDRKGWYLVLVLGFVLLATIIIQIILRGRPSYNQNVIIYIILSLDCIISASIFLSTPRTGVVGDERTKRAAEKAGLCALLILIGCLLLLGLINGLWESIKDEHLLPFVLAHIGIYSWVVLAYYFIKKGDME